MAKTIETFASEECSRCGGTGRHSFNGRHSICYKCGGARFTLTTLGLKARQAWLTANIDEVPGSDIQVGDTVRTGFATLAQLISGDGGRDILDLVTAITFDPKSQGSHSKGVPGQPGYESYQDDGHYTMTTRTAGNVGFCPHYTVKKWTKRIALPTPQEPGTDRKAEMKAYITAAKAAR